MRSLAARVMRCEAAAEYGEWVRQLSYLSPRETLFAGNCKRLAKFLHDAETSGTEHQEGNGFARQHVLGNKTDGNEQDTSSDRCNRALYLSSYPSAQTLLEIGSKYQISPEFFDKRLSFVSDGPMNCKIHPSQNILPSRQPLVFQMSIPSMVASMENGYMKICIRSVKYMLKE